MGRREPLSGQRIIAAAITVADDGGLSGLSMRAVARVLGVEAMSLYHHVPNKSALLDGMVDRLFAEIYQPRVGSPWREELRARSLSAREVLLRHPWAVGLMDSRRTPGEETLRHHDAVLGCLHAGGFDWQRAGHAFALLDSHLYGFVLQESNIPIAPGESWDAMAADMLDPLPDGEFPHLQAFAQARVRQPGYSFGAEFPVGLDLVLDAIEQRLSGEPPGGG